MAAHDVFLKVLWVYRQLGLEYTRRTALLLVVDVTFHLEHFLGDHEGDLIQVAVEVVHYVDQQAGLRD